MQARPVFERENKLKIAIVGTGIAGLTAGWLMEQAGHDIVLFERLSTFGMAAHAVEIDNDFGSFTVDVPPRMFNDVQWPNLVGLYERLGVEFEPVELSKSYSHPGQKSYLYLNGSLQPKLSPSLLGKTPRRISADARKMMNGVSQTPDIGNGLTLRDFLSNNQYSDEFVYEFLYPSLSSTVCTCSYQSLDDYPASLILKTLVDIIGLDFSSSRPLMRTRFGTHDVAKRLAANLDGIRFNTTIVSATSDSRQVRVISESGDKQAETVFDHLIVATQANQSLKFLSNLPPHERKILATFQYEAIETVVHNDPSLLPPGKSNWAAFNFVSDSKASMCSVWANRFQPGLACNTDIFQTINPIVEVKAEHQLARRTLQRPVVTQRSENAWQAISELHAQPDRRIWYCGSYASHGVPLLESGVVSSLNVATALGIELPRPLSPSPSPSLV